MLCLLYSREKLPMETSPRHSQAQSNSWCHFTAASNVTLGMHLACCSWWRDGLSHGPQVMSGMSQKLQYIMGEPLLLNCPDTVSRERIHCQTSSQHPSAQWCWEQTFLDVRKERVPYRQKHCKPHQDSCKAFTGLTNRTCSIALIY